MATASQNLLADLSNYELMDLFFTVNSNVTGNLTVFISALSAYLALAYIAGKNLTRFQVTAITIIYSFFTLFMTGGIYRDFVIASDIAYALYDVSTTRDAVIIASVLILGWLLSIAFMLQVRRTKDG